MNKQHTTTKQHRTSILFIFIMILAIFSCTEGEYPGPLATEERVVSAFDGIHVESIGEVNLHVAQEYKVVIRTNSNVLDDIILTISEEKLYINLTGRHKKIDKLEFDVYAPEYTEIILDGVADIRSDELLTTDEMRIEQDGVGNIYLADVDVQNISFRLEEVGNVDVKGTADEILVVHSGVGNLRLFDLSARIGDLKLSGTGNIDINVSEQLKIDLSGVGDIRYLGNPSMTVNHTGVGKIIRIN
jgi:hypothetical protein